MDKPSTIIDQTIFSGVSSYYFTLFYINSLIVFVTNLVAEKENKAKEVNKIMGMYDSTFWLSWIIVYLIPFTVLNLIISLVLRAVEFFLSNNITIVFFVLIQMFSLTTISFGMVFTTLFKKSKTAGAACGGFYSLSSILYFAVFIPRQFGIHLPLVAEWALTIFYPFTFALAIDQVREKTKFRFKYILVTRRKLFKYFLSIENTNKYFFKSKFKYLTQLDRPIFSRRDYL